MAKSVFMKRGKIIFMLMMAAFSAAAQNVGIGTSSPTRGKLVIEGVAEGGATNAIFGNNQAGISMQENWPTIGFNQYRDVTGAGTSGRYMKTGYAALISISQDNGIMFLQSFGYNIGGNYTGAGSIGWAVKPTGNMAIGHGNPAAMLDVVRGSGSYAPDGTAVFRGTLYNSHFNYAGTEHTYIRGGKTGSNVYINDNPSGNVFLGGGAAYIGVNTFSTAGAGTLAIRQVGEEGIGLLNDNWGGYRWELNNEKYSETSQSLVLRYSGRANPIMGWFRPTDGGYTDNSDSRLKQNIHAMPAVLDKVLQLKPSSYQFISNKQDAPNQFGLIAQEVKTLFPELVDVRQLAAGDGNIRDLHGMNYSGLSVVAIKAIQEQQEEIKKLRQLVSLLGERLVKLEREKN
jgi:hypothetical protein